MARAAFIRLRDVRSVELVNQVAAGLVAGTPHNLLRANVAAWQGDFDQAAKLYVSEGQLEKVRVACCRMGAGMASTSAVIGSTPHSTSRRKQLCHNQRSTLGCWNHFCFLQLPGAGDVHQHVHV